MADVRKKKLQHPGDSQNNPDKVLLIYGVVVLIFLAGCSPKTTNVTLPLETPETFSGSGTAEVPEKWWTTFNDDELNAKVDSALVSNFDLKTAWQRLRAAQAIIERESSGLFPDFGISLQGGVDYPQPDYVGGESFRLGLSSGYEVDLWGRIRSGVEAEEYRATATRADYQAAALSLSAEIVRTWFQLTEALSQLELVEEQIETNRNMLDLLKNRFGSGQIRSADILRQRQLVEATREQKISVETGIRILEHRLNVLLGRSPQEEFSLPAPGLPELPPVPETGIPAELVRRRPDVQSAFSRLQAADRDLASAISNQYPRFSINASMSVRANNVNQLFEGWAYNLAGNLFAPVFQGKALSAEADRSEAVKNQRLYEYGQTILTAFQEVEDALTREQKQVERIQSIEEQLELARQTYEQLRLEYFNGMSNYLDVLTALGEEQQLRRDLISANQTLFEYRIALYRAIAGEFETSDVNGEPLDM